MPPGTLTVLSGPSPSWERVDHRTARSALAGVCTCSVVRRGDRGHRSCPGAGGRCRPAPRMRWPVFWWRSPASSRFCAQCRLAAPSTGWGTAARAGQPILVSLWGTSTGWADSQISLLMVAGAGIELCWSGPRRPGERPTRQCPGLELVRLQCENEQRIIGRACPGARRCVWVQSRWTLLA